MARSIWSGAVGFGLVSVPVRMIAAVRDKSVRFHLLAPDGTCRLRQKLYCPETDTEYSFKDTARGYEIAPDQYVIINDKELKRLRPEAGRSIHVLAFVELGEIDPVYYDHSYYLVPDESGAKAYQLLVKAMTTAGKVALAQFVMRDREHLATLRAVEGALVLHTMHYQDEIVEPSSLPEIQHETPASTREVKVAEQLIESLTTHFEPEAYRDEFRQKLQKAIETKAQGEEIVTAASESAEAPPVYNLMEALKQSLAQQERKSRRPAPRPAAGRRRRKSA